MTPIAALVVAAVALTAVASGALARHLGQAGSLGWLTGAVLLGLGAAAAGELGAGGVRAAASDPAVTALAQLALVLALGEAGHEIRRRGTAEPPVGSTVRSTVGGPARSRTWTHVTWVTLGTPVLAVPLAWLVCRPHVPAGDLPLVVAFVVVVLSVTALPVLLPVVATLRDGPFQQAGARALRVAAASDVLAWLALAVLVARHGRPDAATVPATADLPTGGPPGLALGALVLATALVLLRVARRPGLSTTVVAPVLLAALLLGSAGAEVLGVHGSIGALAIGLLLPDTPGVRRTFEELSPVLYGVLLPLLLATAIARIDVGTLTGSTSMLVVGVVAVAVVCKAVPALAAGLRARDGGVETLVFAALVNARGATDIVVVTVGVAVLPIPVPVAFALVAMAVLTTLALAPVLAVAHRSIGRGGPAGGRTDATGTRLVGRTGP